MKKEVTFSSPYLSDITLIEAENSGSSDDGAEEMIMYTLLFLLLECSSFFLLFDFFLAEISS